MFNTTIRGDRGPRVCVLLLLKTPVMEVVGHRPSAQHALWQHSGDQTEEAKESRKEKSIQNKIMLPGKSQERWAGQNIKCSLCQANNSENYFKGKKVKSTAYDLPRPHSCISIKNYSTGNTASHCTVTMRHFRGLSKRVNKKMLAHGMEKRHKVAIRFMLIT